MRYCGILLLMIFFAANCKKETLPNCFLEITADNNLLHHERIIGKDGDQYEVRNLIASGDGDLYYQGLFNEKVGNYYTVIVGQNGSPDTIPTGLNNKKIYQFGKMDADFNIIWAVSSTVKIQKILALGNNAGVLSNGLLVLIDDQVMLYDRNGNNVSEKDLDVIHPTGFNYFGNVLWLSENALEISYVYTGTEISQMASGNYIGYPCLVKFTVLKLDNSIQVNFKKVEITKPNSFYPYSIIDPINPGRFLAGDSYNNFDVYDFDGNYLEKAPYFNIARSTFLEKARVTVFNNTGSTTITGDNYTAQIPRSYAYMDYFAYDQAAVQKINLDDDNRRINLEGKIGLLASTDAYYNSAFEYNSRLFGIGQIRQRSSHAEVCAFDCAGFEAFDLPSGQYKKRYCFSPSEIEDKTSQFTQALLMGNDLFLVGTINKPGEPANQQAWLTKIRVLAL